MHRLFYRPTVLAEVPLTSPVFTEEVFGPVAPITKISSVEGAVRLASDSDYGLSLGIVTRDVMRGLALAEQIPTGIVHINDQTVNDEANVPFGGVGASGWPARRRDREHRGVHRDPLDHDARGAGELPVLIDGCQHHTSDPSRPSSGVLAPSECAPLSRVRRVDSFAGGSESPRGPGGRPGCETPGRPGAGTPS